MTDFTQLDSPVWFSLASGHKSLARMHGDAVRYPADISPFGALRENSRKAFDDMRALVPPDGAVAFATAAAVDVPPGWEVLRARMIDQMVCENFKPASAIEALTLSDKDVPEMVALTKATQPGPFEHGTIGMGDYIGVRDPDGKLIAMCGERMSLDRFREISAVCTDPAHQGKGYAGKLMTIIANRIIARGKMPFLHVMTENMSAKHLYEKLGFRIRKELHLTVVKPL